jgi:hypothetical protein
MRTGLRKLGWAAALMIPAAVVAVWAVASGRDDAPTTQPDAAPVAGTPRPNPSPSNALPPAANLQIHAAQSAERADLLLDPAKDDWQRAQPVAILLSRAPRLYQTEKPAWQQPVPALKVRAIRAAERLYLHLEWPDATRNAPAAPPAKRVAGPPEQVGGQPERLYHRPTAQPEAFPDAAAVMVPDRWTGPEFPSLMMGDADRSATIYYFNASRGSAVLSAGGRATPQPMPGRVVRHRSAHNNNAWRLVLELPDQPDGYPLAFAVWDGALGDRDGLKWFSIWYVLRR